MEPPNIHKVAGALKNLAETLNRVQRDLWLLAAKVENQTGNNREIQAPPFFSETSLALSDSEKNLMIHISHGKTNDEIATALKLSPNTIATYRKRLLKKLKLKNTAQLVRFTMEHVLG